MGLTFENLDDETRKYMLEEIELDERAETLYRSPWLSQGGQGDWADLLKEAAARGSDDTLAGSLRLRGRIVSRAQRRKPNSSSQYVWYNLPQTAADTMAGEFNVFYCRGLCRRALTNGIPRLEIYRARKSKEPRYDSEQKLGLLVDPEVVLIDLRATHGTQPTFGLPPGPNTGLTLRISH